MGTPPLPPLPAPQEFPDSTERLLIFLRTEHDNNRELLREDSRANREMLLGTIKLVSFPVGAAILIAGALGIKSFVDLKNQLSEYAKKQIDIETVRIQGEIRTRLSSEFETPKIRESVQAAARAATETAAQPLIKSEITRQVQTHIREEEPQIHNQVIIETKKGVAGIQPVINAEIAKQAEAAEARIQAKIAPYDELLTLGMLATSATNGSGADFDKLMLFSSSPNDRVRQLVTSTRNGVFSQFQEDYSFAYLRQEFRPAKTKEEMIGLMASDDPMTRKAALDGLAGEKDGALIESFMRIMRSDPFIIVRRAAHRTLNISTGQQLNPIDGDGWEKWWKMNKNNWPPKPEAPK